MTSATGFYSPRRVVAFPCPTFIPNLNSSTFDLNFILWFLSRCTEMYFLWSSVQHVYTYTYLYSSVDRLRGHNARVGISLPYSHSKTCCNARQTGSHLIFHSEFRNLIINVSTCLFMDSDYFFTMLTIRILLLPRRSEFDNQGLRE